MLSSRTWAAWSVGVGALAGHWLEGNPLLGSVAGVVVALALGVVVDRAARRVNGWGRMPSAAAAGDDGSADPPVAVGATP